MGDQGGESDEALENSFEELISEEDDDTSEDDEEDDEDESAQSPDFKTINNKQGLRTKFSK